MQSLIETVSTYLRNPQVTAVLLDGGLKSLVVLAVAGGACCSWRRASAATRHWVWFLALASLLSLPVLSVLLPAWPRPLWTVSTDLNSGYQLTLAIGVAPRTATGPPAPAARDGVTQMEPAGHSASRENRIVTQVNAQSLVVAPVLWLTGVILVLGFGAVGRVRLQRIRRNARALESTGWMSLLQELRQELNIRRPVRFLQSVDQVMPMTWGWWRPVVLLPAEADQWTAERQRVVLFHELAHVGRWDCLTQAITRLVCAFYWFNPLAWVAARRMCVERERACDDLVLTGGCKASDYASHLVDIARTFRRVPQAAAIAMARPSGLGRRVTAIVDGHRNRNQVAKRTAVFLTLAVLGFGCLIGACATATRTPRAMWSIERSAVGDQLKRFVAEKEAQAYAAVKPEGTEVLPEYQAMFAAAAKGDWLRISNIWEGLRARAPQYEGSGPKDDRLHGTAWQTMLEIWGGFGNIAVGEEKHVVGMGQAIIASIPPGSIYFGGTDPGRCVVTALQPSQVQADPFFTLTQNALADGTYLAYLQRMYGRRIYVATEEDSKKCFDAYVTDAQRRMEHDRDHPTEPPQIRPGENVRMIDGRVQVTGQVAVMAINALLSKTIFDHNPDREFYVEESFPLDWMYPHLTPAGPIMKLNRQPLAVLSDEAMQRDREYWSRQVEPMIGDWLHDDTSVREIAAFAGHAYSKQAELDRFITVDGANKWTSKLRSSIAGLYVWRAGRSASASEKSRLVREADFAFRQAYALCPYSPEAVFRYANLLVSEKRVPDALLLAEAATKLQPTDQFRNLVKELKRLQKPR